MRAADAVDHHRNAVSDAILADESFGEYQSPPCFLFSLFVQCLHDHIHIKALQSWLDAQLWQVPIDVAGVSFVESARYVRRHTSDPRGIFVKN